MSDERRGPSRRTTALRVLPALMREWCLASMSSSVSSSSSLGSGSPLTSGSTSGSPYERSSTIAAWMRRRLASADIVDPC